MHYICTINEANMGIQIAAISARYQAQMMEKMQQGAGTHANKQAAESTEGTVQVGLNMQKMMENMQKQAEENMEVFGVTTPGICKQQDTRR